ncbi:MAG: hypothetical protein ACUBOA_10550 [Candidatus Loosdrechtia sp.]|uniref:hypothetical protein n=1 Tax=Candidatus Loosdrechtia sp. TaxID=3101272 RepID=UPI003A7082D4|nr:MAG: hypothetical protein QY305_05980 [Candidatus Jettenia sp. AMX2]
MSLITHELVNKMTYALKTEYEARKGISLPPGYEADREILFAAIARGMLEYLEDKQNEFISTITLREGGASKTYNVTGLDLNIDRS